MFLVPKLRKISRKTSLFLFSAVLLAAAAIAGIYWFKSPTRQISAFKSVRTLAGMNREFGEPFGIALKSGEIYVSDGEKGKIWKIGSEGNVSIFADGLDTPSGLAFDKSGNLFVADSGSNTIRKISAKGEITNFAGVENQSGFADGDALAALFNAPIGIAVAPDGKVYVADTYNDRIRLIENGQVRTIAGEIRGFADGVGKSARFDTPCGLAILPDGRLLVADSGNLRLRIVETNGNTSTLAGNGPGDFRDGLLSNAAFVRPLAVAAAPSGEIFVADGNAVRVIRQRSFLFVETISNDRRGFKDGKLKGAQFNRPSGLAFDSKGNLLVADSDNQAVRAFAVTDIGKETVDDQVRSLRETAEEFRSAGPPRWPYDPPQNTREVAGTFGEIRGEIPVKDDGVWFHNGLDIAGGYGEKARFVRGEKVLLPFATDNFGTLRELVRMPQLGYVHIRLGRDSSNRPLGDARFQFVTDESGRLTGVRIPRGSKFNSGDVVGTLNPMNHVHLIAGRSGDEMNALEGLILPGISDSRPPTIEKVSLFDENWAPIETESKAARIKLTGKTRIVVRAYDQVDGNADRRRLGLFRIGYQILRESNTPLGEPNWTIKFDRLPQNEAVPLVYAVGSKSGATGETIFNYIATNTVDGEISREDFLDAGIMENGTYTLRVFAADYFGNTASKDIIFEVIK